ncbi:2'-5' RNA ligase family protein [Pengzhenrongella sp.]|uniref:2'-5' RNA ligase family protein n=1 Tax=Pengzhenrongella sp. TaxID=2888820 RepID=UPI002F957683
MLTKPVQSLGFALVQARERVRPGGVVVHDADPRPRYVTSVIRVGDDLSGVLTEVARGLPGVAGHYLYPRSDLHLTVLNLDTARQRAVADRVDAAQDVLADAEPFPVVLAGLGISRRSIYARAYDPTGSLLRVRARLAEATGCRPPWPLRLLGFVNLLRFTQPSVGDPLAGWTDRRRTALGTFEAAAVEIVHTDKVLSTAGTVVLHRIALNG